MIHELNNLWNVNHFSRIICFMIKIILCSLNSSVNQKMLLYLNKSNRKKIVWSFLSYLNENIGVENSYDIIKIWYRIKIFLFK